MIAHHNRLLVSYHLCAREMNKQGKFIEGYFGVIWPGNLKPTKRPRNWCKSNVICLVFWAMCYAVRRIYKSKIEDFDT